VVARNNRGAGRRERERVKRGGALKKALVLLVLAALAVGPLMPQAGASPVPAGAGAHIGISASAHPIPNESNEDGTLYPGDSLRIEYSSRWDSSTTFDHVLVEGDCISSRYLTAPSGSATVTVLADAGAGVHTVTVTASGTYTYQVQVNVTDCNASGYPVGWHWEWEDRQEPVSAAAHVSIEVVQYDPHFTLALYPITKRETDTTTYRMDLALLVRYDGNGPSCSLRQRAVVDRYSSSVLGTATFFITSLNDLPPLTMRGFYGLRPATAEDFTAPEDISSLNLPPDAIRSTFGSPLNATYNGTSGTVYIGYRNCPEYGPSAVPGNFTAATFTSNENERYARYVFAPGAAQVIEDLEIGNLDVNITLSWSRFPSVERTASAGLPYLKVREPLTVATVAVTPTGTLAPAAAKINFSVAPMNENDLLFYSFFEPPAEGDEWFTQQWAADSTVANTTAAGILAEYSSTSTSLTGLVPRTASCYYNLTVSTSAPDDNGYTYTYTNTTTFTTVTVRTNTASTSGWVPLLIDFDEDTCEVVVNVNPDVNTFVTYFTDYLSWDGMRVVTGQSTLKSATIFSVDGSGERTVWRTISWKPQYGEGKGTYYDLWAEKPKTLDHNTTVYVEVTDVWGNTQVLEAGTATPYAEGFYNIPYSGILVVIFMVVGAMLLYEVLQKVASRL